MLISLPTMVAMAVLANVVDVRSATNCPSSEAILARLQPLVASVGEAEDVAWVEVGGTGQSQGDEPTTEVRLRLLRPDASVVADRTLVLQGGCDDMADTIATVLAAWETQPVAQPVPAVTEVRQIARAPESVALAWWLGVAGGAGVTAGAAATGSLELSADREAARGWARLALVAQTERERGLAAGTVSWRRTHASLGVGLRSLGSHWRLSADAGLLLGWLSVSGQGFAPDDRQGAFEVGGAAGLRAQRQLGAWMIWLDGRVDVWPQKQRAVLSGSSSNVLLPRADALLTIGVSRLVFR